MEKICKTCIHDNTINNSCSDCDSGYSGWAKNIRDDVTRNKAMLLVTTERDSQETLWGQQNHPQQAWVGILGEEFGEYCQAVNETYLNNATEQHKGGYENLLTELTHVAAVAVGAIESLMRNRGNE